MTEKSKKTLSRVITAVALLLCCGFVFMVVNTFTGNPVSVYVASKRILEYIEKTYPDQPLEVSQVKYTFPNSAYYARVQAADSIDTSFTVSFSRGKVSDDYEYEVANHFTTYRRLSEAFDGLVTGIIEARYPGKTTRIIGDLVGDTQLLTPDAPLNLDEMPLALSLNVSMLSEARDEHSMAALLTELHQLMQKNGISIDRYTLRLEEPLPEDMKPGSAETLHLIDFPASGITDDPVALAADIRAFIAEAEQNDKS